MPRAGKMKECSRRPRETDHVSTTCGEAHELTRSWWVNQELIGPEFVESLVVSPELACLESASWSEGATYCPSRE